MKNFYKSTLSALGMSLLFFGANAQTTFHSQSDAEAFYFSEPASIEKAVQSNSGIRATETCSDTSRWTWARSLQNNGTSVQATYFGVTMNADTNFIRSYGTYVDVPAGTSIDVSGFGFYGSSLRGDDGNVTVNAVMYAAGSDSLPTGAALATVAVTLDTSNTGFIEPMYREAVFSAPVNVTGSVVLTIETTSDVNDTVLVLRGYTGSGSFDGQPSVYQITGFGGGAYTRLEGFNEGVRLPHIYPFVSFDQTNDFSMSVTKLSSANEVVDFTYTAPSVTDHPIWSISGYLQDTTSSWSFDGGSTFTQARNTSNTFVDETVDYTIVLNDTIAMWLGNDCILSETKTLEKADSTVTSIEDVAKGKFHAYAFESEIFVANGKGTANIYNITGRLVKQAVINNQIETINVADLKEGIYILEVDGNVLQLKL